MTFREALDAAIARRAMLDHPFYQAWSEGRLDIEVLRRYAAQYFAQVKAFPTYVSGVHAQSEDLELRRHLLDNLVEEEGGDDNHPELWLRFAEALGASREEVEAAELLPQTQESVASLKELTQRKGVIAGLAALYAYESQIPNVAATKRAGLKEFYDIDDARAVSFFTVHEQADLAHSAIERVALERLCDTPEREAEACEAAEAGAQALWTFLDGMCEATMPELLAK